MTNTKFRKRALLSAVAMLLVALVALGSATFAWFVANPSVTAKGISMTTSASSGLLVRSESVSAISGAPFSKETKLGANGVVEGKTAAEAKLATDFTSIAARDVQPATFDATLNSSGELVFKSSPAKESSKSDLADTPVWTTQTAQTYSNSTGTLYKEKIYIKTSDGATENATVAKASVKIAPGTSADGVKNAIRVALVQHQGGTTPVDTLIGVWGPANGQDAAGKKSGETGFAFKTGEANAAYANYFVSEAEATTTLVVDAGLNTNYFTAYIYLDGYDKQCFSDNVTTSLDTILDSVEITFTKST